MPSVNEELARAEALIRAALRERRLVYIVEAALSLGQCRARAEHDEHAQRVTDGEAELWAALASLALETRERVGTSERASTVPDRVATPHTAPATRRP